MGVKHKKTHIIKVGILSWWLITGRQRFAGNGMFLRIRGSILLRCGFVGQIKNK